MIGREWLLLVLLMCLSLDGHAVIREASSVSGRWLASFESELEPVAINRMHSWILTLRTPAGYPVDGAEISVRGGMPGHDHGLPSSPRVTRSLGDGRYLIEGLKFHMNGRWELELDVEHDGIRDTVILRLVL